MDTRQADLLASGKADRLLLPQRLNSYAVRGGCAQGRALPVNESLLSHFDTPLKPHLLIGLSLRDSLVLEASSRAHSEAFSSSMWVLSGLLGYIRLQGFTPADPDLFHVLVSSLSKSLAHQAHISAAHTAFMCLRRREFLFVTPSCLF